ncbi:MAG: hypothetical protein AAGA56_08380 [Myxococcota bacterium]
MRPPDAAVPEDEPAGFAFDAMLGTTFPISLGPSLSLEIPGRVLLQGEVGWLPPGYGSAIVGIVEGVGDEDAILGPAIENAVNNSLVLRLSAGWRPFADYGFEFFAGYTTIGVNGEADPVVVGDIIDGEVGAIIETELTENIDVSARLHNFHVALGWRFLALRDHLVIRASLGYTQTVGAGGDLEISERPEVEEQARPIFQSELSRILRRDVKLPLIGISAGYRF